MKMITITPQLQSKIIDDFSAYIKERLGSNKINYSTSIEDALKDTEVVKPVIYFTPEAYLKVLGLVNNTSDEIGWHGAVVKEGNKYTIKDIYVYPQQVTAATVNTDQGAYNEWLMELPDEVFNILRFQGHSHVNMGVSPSTVDEHLYERIMQTLGSDDYYIFMIFNKRNDIEVLLYDVAQNVVFEKKDIKIHVLVSDSQSLVDWQKAITEGIVTKGPLTKAQTKIAAYEEDYRQYHYEDARNEVQQQYYSYKDKKNKKNYKERSPKYATK